MDDKVILKVRTFIERLKILEVKTVSSRILQAVTGLLSQKDADALFEVLIAAGAVRMDAGIFLLENVDLDALCQVTRAADKVPALVGAVGVPGGRWVTVDGRYHFLPDKPFSFDDSRDESDDQRNDEAGERDHLNFDL
jgi:hypothetical protein